MKNNSIKVTVNPNPKHSNKSIAALIAPITATVDIPIPETVEEWAKLVGEKQLCAFAERIYLNRAKTGLRNLMLGCVNKETGVYSPDQERFNTRVKELAGDFSKRSSRKRKLVEDYLAKITVEELETLIKREATRRGISLE